MGAKVLMFVDKGLDASLEIDKIVHVQIQHELCSKTILQIFGSECDNL